MAVETTIEWSQGAFVPARLAVQPGGAPVGVLLAHGAGAGQNHAFMRAVFDGLVAGGVTVLSFDYPYIAAGRKRPDAPLKLLACHAAAARRLASEVDTVVLAGKSMGGRIGSHLAAGIGPKGEQTEPFSAGGLVYFGYPLVAMGKSEPRDVSHLHHTGAPSLFISGTRDALGPIDLVRRIVAELPNATLYEVEDGNHSLHVPKRSGRTDAEVLVEVVAVTIDWIGSHSAHGAGM